MNDQKPWECVVCPTFIDTGEGKADIGLRRGEVGAFEGLDRVWLIEISDPPSRMLFRAFNL